MRSSRDMMPFSLTPTGCLSIKPELFPVPPHRSRKMMRSQFLFGVDNDLDVEVGYQTARLHGIQRSQELDVGPF